MLQPLRPQLPLTPESPAEPTFLPHVRDALPPLGLATHESPLLSSAAPAAGSKPDCAAVRTGLNVLLHERDALVALHHLYATSPPAQCAFAAAVTTIAHTVQRGGRLVVSGVGKSGWIGQKLVATCNSLRVRACFMHAGEAVHGDLGMVGPVRSASTTAATGIANGDPQDDTLLLMTYSATTPELLSLVPHIPATMPVIIMTGAFAAAASASGGGDPGAAGCRLFAHRPADACTNITLACPIPVTEVAAMGVGVPTMSTTVALALGDALGLAAAERIDEGEGGKGLGEVFRKTHPGGSIGLKYGEERLGARKRPRDVEVEDGS